MKSWNGSLINWVSFAFDHFGSADTAADLPVEEEEKELRIKKDIWSMEGEGDIELIEGVAVACRYKK